MTELASGLFRPNNGAIGAGASKPPVRGQTEKILTLAIRSANHWGFVSTWAIVNIGKLYKCDMRGWVATVRTGEGW